MSKMGKKFKKCACFRSKVRLIIRFVHFYRTPIKKVPIVGGEAVDMFTLYQKVIEMGGFTKVGKF